MVFTDKDYEQLQKLMAEKPENREIIQKLLDFHQYTISKISHEIRNPLTLVYSTLQLIESSHPEVLHFKHWNSMRDDIEFMTQLLQELSSYNNSNRLCRKPFSSYEFFSRLCLSFAASCAETEIEFSSKIPPGLPELNGDSVKLREAFLNLLRNAADAVSPIGSIRLEVCWKNASLDVKVSDTGCGIPQEQLCEIFDPFVTHKSGGTGLGLAIVKQTVEAHGGTVQVKSTLNKGSCFTVSLPVT